MWEAVKNVVIVSDYKGLPVDKIKEIVESNSKYRIIDALDYSNFEKDMLWARKDLMTRVTSSKHSNVLITLTAKNAWAMTVYYVAKNRNYKPYHLLEPEILSGLSMTAQTNLYGLIQSTGVDMAEFKAAAEYMESLREKN